MAKQPGKLHLLPKKSLIEYLPIGKMCNDSERYQAFTLHTRIIVVKNGDLTLSVHVMKNIHLLLALFMFLLSACTTSVGAELSDPSDDSAGPVKPSATLQEVEAPAIEAPEPTTGHQEVTVTEERALLGGAEKLVDLAKRDLAQRLDVEISPITLVSYEEVVWPDTSLGCPQPGMAYRQIPQDGVRIQLSFEGTTYDYHGGGGRDPFLCEQTLPQRKKIPVLLN